METEGGVNGDDDLYCTRRVWCRGGVCQILFIHGIELKFLLIMGFCEMGF